MNQLITLAIALGNKLAGLMANGTKGFGSVSVVTFNSGVTHVDVNGDVYAWREDIGWSKPDVGDYAPSIYEKELRARLIAGVVHYLSANTDIPLKEVASALPVPPPVQAKPVQAKVATANKQYRRSSPVSGKPTSPTEPCRRCYGTGEYPHPTSHEDKKCLWCQRTGLQAHGWATHGPNKA